MGFVISQEMASRKFQVKTHFHFQNETNLTFHLQVGNITEKLKRRKREQLNPSLAIIEQNSNQSYTSQQKYRRFHF